MATLEVKNLEEREGIRKLLDAAYTAYVTEVMMECAQEAEASEELDERTASLADCIMVYLNNNAVRTNVMKPTGQYLRRHNRTTETQAIQAFQQFFNLEYPDRPEDYLPTVFQMVYHCEQGEDNETEE